MAIEPKIIESEDERIQVTTELAKLSEASSIASERDRNYRNLLAKLLEDYEFRSMAQCCTDPVDAIQLRMKELGLRQKDLVPLLGGKNRVSEILARRRPLTLAMIRALNRDLRIPATLLIREILVKKDAALSQGRSQSKS